MAKKTSAQKLRDAQANNRLYAKKLDELMDQHSRAQRECNTWLILCKDIFQRIPDAGRKHHTVADVLDPYKARECIISQLDKYTADQKEQRRILEGQVRVLKEVIVEPQTTRVTR